MSELSQNYVDSVWIYHIRSPEQIHSTYQWSLWNSCRKLKWMNNNGNVNTKKIKLNHSDFKLRSCRKACKNCMKRTLFSISLVQQVLWESVKWARNDWNIFQECSVTSNSSMFIMKVVGRILTPTFTVDIRGLPCEAQVKEITENLTEWIAIHLQNHVFFLLLKMIAKLLAVVCNHVKKCLCARVLLLLSLFLQQLSWKLLVPYDKEHQGSRDIYLKSFSENFVCW